MPGRAHPRAAPGIPVMVEFLPPSPDERGDEQPGERRGRRGRRWFVVVAVAVAVATTVWAAHRSGAPHPAVAPPPAATPRSDPACNRVPNCSVRVGVAAPVARLARRYLPAGAQLHGKTVVAIDAMTHEELLIERDLTAVAGSVTVLVRIARGGSTTRAITTAPPGVGSVLLHEMNNGYLVRLQYLAPETVPPKLALLQAFIRDTRLPT